jgi:hypothetical protein
MRSVRRAAGRRYLPDAFREGLRRVAGADERNIVVDMASANGRPERFTGLVDDLPRLNPDLIVADVTPLGPSVPASVAIRADEVT